MSFSEPVATDSRLSANDNEDGAKSEPSKSILKGTVSDKNRIFEHELDPSIMIRMTSPAESEKTPTKPTMARRSADLRQVLDIWQVAFLGSHRADELTLLQLVESWVLGQLGGCPVLKKSYK